MAFAKAAESFSVAIHLYQSYNPDLKKGCLSETYTQSRDSLKKWTTDYLRKLTNLDTFLRNINFPHVPPPELRTELVRQIVNIFSTAVAKPKRLKEVLREVNDLFITDTNSDKEKQLVKHLFYKLIDCMADDHLVHNKLSTGDQFRTDIQSTLKVVLRDAAVLLPYQYYGVQQALYSISSVAYIYGSLSLLSFGLTMLYDKPGAHNLIMKWKTRQKNTISKAINNSEPWKLIGSSDPLPDIASKTSSISTWIGMILNGVSALNGVRALGHFATKMIEVAANDANELGAYVQPVFHSAFGLATAAGGGPLRHVTVATIGAAAAAGLAKTSVRDWGLPDYDSPQSGFLGRLASDMVASVRVRHAMLTNEDCTNFLSGTTQKYNDHFQKVKKCFDFFQESGIPGKPTSPANISSVLQSAFKGTNALFVPIYEQLSAIAPSFLSDGLPHLSSSVDEQLDVLRGIATFSYLEDTNLINANGKFTNGDILKEMDTAMGTEGESSSKITEISKTLNNLLQLEDNVNEYTTKLVKIVSEGMGDNSLQVSLSIEKAAIYTALPLSKSGVYFEDNDLIFINGRTVITTNAQEQKFKKILFDINQMSLTQKMDFINTCEAALDNFDFADPTSAPKALLDTIVKPNELERKFKASALALKKINGAIEDPFKRVTGIVVKEGSSTNDEVKVQDFMPGSPVAVSESFMENVMQGAEYDDTKIENWEGGDRYRSIREEAGQVVIRDGPIQLTCKTNNLLFPKPNVVVKDDKTQKLKLNIKELAPLVVQHLKSVLESDDTRLFVPSIGTRFLESDNAEAGHYVSIAMLFESNTQYVFDELPDVYKKVYKAVVADAASLDDEVPFNKVRDFLVEVFHSISLSYQYDSPGNLLDTCFAFQRAVDGNPLQSTETATSLGLEDLKNVKKLRKLCLKKWRKQQLYEMTKAQG